MVVNIKYLLFLLFVSNDIISGANYPSHHHSVSYYECTIPPDYWCDSVESARLCGVVQQCETFNRDRKPIKISLMFEALCPYCQRFITNHLGPIYNQFKNYIQLELVPWGNARFMRNGQISCNHGQKECDANKLMGCALDVLHIKQALQFIVCIERSLTTLNVDGALNHCSGFIRSHYRIIKSCYTGPRGIELQRQAAKKTMSVRPNPIVEVPYILINDYSPNLDGNNLNVNAITQLLQKWTNNKRQYKHM
ncbi:Gamma-interferon-inducible lysosomal thiol reductase [Strongyloides ratti]|uniref:Gamma-interferon-inducible lysosomal thiol reductase n=1 Tax=Strongyloides ratti TaxID=34506 RepID=A0A090MQU2_STRRB|nr:Gamma-interferon-inducible lysosomal thiol reductase [Strongyloides ratti]CEF60543.1 Gamma-interferon-inducible lysosomal thiol reductase [Strongyloides ratti]